MRRKQEIRNPLFDQILMSTIRTNQLAIRNRRLHKQRMQILHRLRFFVL